MKSISLLFISLFFAHICTADFPPSDYAIYQLSRIDSIVSVPDGKTAFISPIQSSGISEDLRIWGLGTTDLTDTSTFALGAPWLWPDNDSAGRAVLFPDYQSVSQIDLYRFSNGTGQHTFAFNFLIKRIGKVSLFHYTYTPESGIYEGYVDLDETGRILLSRNFNNDSTLFDTLNSFSFRSGVWIPMVIELNNEDNLRYISIFLGDSCVSKLSCGPAPVAEQESYVSLFSSVVDGDGKLLCGDFAYFQSASGADVFKNYMKWGPVEEAGCMDTVLIPIIVHQILYDPPGDGSVSVLMKGNTITNKLNVKDDFLWGGSAFVGYEATIGVDVGISLDIGGWDAEFSVKGDFNSSTYQSFISNISVNEEYSTSVDGSLVSCIGPGRGDIIIYQAQKLQRTLYRRPLIGTFGNEHDSCYTYYLKHNILLDDSCRLRISRIGDLLESLKNDSAATAILRSEYAIDPLTGRVRRDLIESGRRLAKLDKNWNFSGNIPITSTETRSGSYESQSFFRSAVGTSASLKLLLMGRKAGAEAHFEYGRETGADFNLDSSLTISYTLSDNESWDNFSVDVYYDSLFRVYVFDVDSTDSYSSFPFENNYSKRALDLKVVSADTADSGFAGGMLSYDVNVLYESNPAVMGLPDPVTVTAKIINFAYQSIVTPQEFNIGKNEMGGVKVKLSSPDTGTYNCILRLSLIHPGGDGSMELDIPLEARFKKAQYGIYAGCEENTFIVDEKTSPVSHTFQIELKNVGETSVNIETGVSSVSQGVTYQTGKFSNPVASGQTRNISVALVGTGNNFPFTATFWVKIEDDDSSYREIILTIDTSEVTGIVGKDPILQSKKLQICPRRGGIEIYVPGKDPATVRIFSMSGRCIFETENILGSWALPSYVASGRIVPWIMEVRQGKKRITRKVVFLP